MPKKNYELVARIIDYINDTFKKSSRIPTVQEIADAMGIAKSSASRYLSYMEETGLISKNDRYNGIQTPTIKKMLNMKRRAPILGRVACGFPLFAEENIEGYITLPQEILHEGEYFCLWAEGDSMINAGIKSGDLVICRKQNYADEGQIVVALCDNECATLKRYYIDRKNQQYRLHPENDTMQDMFFKVVEVQGVAVKVFANLE